MKSSLRVLIAAALACLMIGLLAHSADAQEQTSVTITGNGATSTNAVQLACEPISGSTHVATTFADLNIDFFAQLTNEPVFLGSEQVATIFADAIIVNPGLVLEAIESPFFVGTSGRSHPGTFWATTSIEDGQILVLEQRTGVTVNDAVMRELDVFIVRSPELSRIVGWVDITAPPNAIIDGVMSAQIRQAEAFSRPTLLLPRKE